MGHNLDRPIEMWSDDEVAEQYHHLTVDGTDATGRDSQAIAEVAKELHRRGLSFPGAAASQMPETVDWSGESGGEDPGSGALPNPV